MPLLALVLGKNPELSLAEVVSYLRARRIPFRIRELLGDLLVIDSGRIIDAADFGGLLKVIECFGPVEQKDVAAALARLDTKFLFPELKDRMAVGLSCHGGPLPDREELEDIIRGKLRAEGIRPSLHPPQHAEAFTHTDGIRKNLAEVAVITFATHCYIGATRSVHNPHAFRARDTGRPVQRPVFSIPPRIARVMVNLTGIRDGVLLDPFCGIGGILQEALLSGLKVRGVDLDKRVVMYCKTNLAWLGNTFKVRLGNLDEMILSGDARNLRKRFRPDSLDAAATEPYLGPPLEFIPGPPRARLHINALVPLYRDALASIHTVLKPGGRLVLIAPRIVSQAQAIKIEIQNLVKPIGFRVVDPLEETGLPHHVPLLDADRYQRIIREIWILEKTEGPPVRYPKTDQKPQFLQPFVLSKKRKPLKGRGRRPRVLFPGARQGRR